MRQGDFRRVSRWLPVSLLLLVGGAALAWALWGGAIATPPSSVASPVPGARRPAGAAGESSRTEGPTERDPIPQPKPTAPPRDDALHGRVVDPDGQPVAGAVACFVTLAAGSPAHQGPRGVAACDAAGTFALPIDAAARVDELLLVGRAPGWRPASRRVWFERDRGVEHELVLEPGCELVGRVVRDGEGVAGAELALDLRFGIGGVHFVPGFFSGAGYRTGLGLSEACWLGGRLEEKLARATADQAGRFRFTGLVADTYQLQVQVPGQSASLVDFTRQVRAPDRALVVDVGTARLALLVVGAAGPLRDATVTVTADAGARRVAMRSRTTPLVVHVPPHDEVHVVVEHARAATVELDVATPPRGIEQLVEIPIEPVERSNLNLRLAGAARAGVDRIAIALWSHARGQAVSAGSSTLHRGPDDMFRLEPMPVDPGAYDLIVKPTGQTGASAHVMPMATFLEVPPRGEVAVELELQVAGTFEARVDSPSDEALEASVRLVDARGNAHWSRQVVRPARTASPGGDAESEAWISMFSLGGGQDLVQQERFSRGLVPAGRYTLEVDAAGHHPCRREVVITAGEAMALAVELEPIGR